MKETIISGKSARKKMLEGINKRSRVVMSTLGPKGRNVLFKNGIGEPQATNDGLTAALETVLTDPYEKLAGDSLVDVARKVKTEAGDSSTTAITVASGIANRGFKAIDKGADPNELKRGIIDASKDIVALLKEIAIPVVSPNQARDIATISSESSELGELIANVVSQVGIDGIITVGESSGFKTEATVVKGMQFDGGYVSPNMVTEEDTLESIMENAIIVVIDKKLTNSDNIHSNIIQVITRYDNKRECVIIANDFDSDVMTFFASNRLRGNFKALLIKSSGFGHRKFDMLNDICLMTGATLINPELGNPLKDAKFSDFGFAKKVISTQYTTTLIESAGNKDKIAEKAEDLKVQMAQAESWIEKDVLKKRIAKLIGGVGIIKVGAHTELEMQYLRLKIQDAVRATQSAMQEGYIAGGGSVLYKIALELESMKVANKGLFKSLFLKNTDFEKGYFIMCHAITAPIHQLLKNSKNGRVIPLKFGMYSNWNSGYDAKNNVFTDDLVKDGVIDPVKATRSVVEHSASGISTLLTVEHILDNA